jgi:hypothetical protein
MSPTLLEGAIVLVILFVAWQIGVILAPTILRWLRGVGRDLDPVDDTVDEVTKERTHHGPQ